MRLRLNVEDFFENCESLKDWEVKNTYLKNHPDASDYKKLELRIKKKRKYFRDGNLQLIYKL